MPTNESLRDHCTFHSNAIIETCRKDLMDILDSIRGKKTLILDSSLSGPLSQVTDFPLLQSHGVDKIFQLTIHAPPETIKTDTKSIVFISRPSVENVQAMTSFIRMFKESSNTRHDYRVIYVPRKTHLCDRIFEEEGLYGDVSTSTLHLGLLPIEDDVLSLELPVEDAWKKLFIQGDYDILWEVAKSLSLLDSLYGPFQRILGKGDNAKMVATMMRRMRKEESGKRKSNVESKGTFSPGLIPSGTLTDAISCGFEIDSLLILDRSVDSVTPLCTQLTYEGLVDEVFAVKNSQIEMDASLLGEGPSSSAPSSSAPSPAGPSSVFTTLHKKKKVTLNNKDPLYRHLRDCNFSAAGSYLNQIAKNVKDSYDARHQANNISQVREFFQLLPSLQSQHASLKLHTTIAELVRNYTVDEDFDRTLEIQQNFLACTEEQSHLDMIEEFIHRKLPLKTVLRLCCLWSLASGGVKSKLFDVVRREIIQTYGFHTLITLEYLQKAGLFVKKGNEFTGVVGGNYLQSGEISSSQTKGFSLTSSKSPYSQLCKLLHLIVDSVDERVPNDISYVYSGYAPISIRLLQLLSQKPGLRQKHLFDNSRGSSPEGEIPLDPLQFNGWQGLEDISKLLPGKHFDENIKEEDGSDSAAYEICKLKSNDTKQKYTLVFFLGGCTFTEISAVRFISNDKVVGLTRKSTDESSIPVTTRKWLVGTTGIINGNSLVESVFVPGR